MIHPSNTTNHHRGFLPIHRSRGTTTSTTLYPLHQTREILRQLRPGSTAAPTNLVDACLLDVVVLRSTQGSQQRSNSNNNAAAATATTASTSTAASSNNNYSLVQILDEVLNILQDDSDCLDEPEEPRSCSPHRSNNNGNSNSPPSP